MRGWWEGLEESTVEAATGDTLLLFGYISIAHRAPPNPVNGYPAHMYRCFHSLKSMPDDHHEFSHSRPYQAKTPSDRAFGRVIGALLVVLTIKSAFYAGQSWPWYAAAAAACLMISWLRPTFLAPLNRAWTWVGMLLGQIIASVVVGVLFFFVVTPVALLVRRLKKDFFRLGRDPAAVSYWIVRDPPGPASTTMRDQF